MINTILILCVHIIIINDLFITCEKFYYKKKIYLYKKIYNKYKFILKSWKVSE